jgi:PAP2 superfamily protein
MNKFRDHLLITMQQYNFAWSHALVGTHCKKRIPTFLITLAIVALIASPMRNAAAVASPDGLTGPGVLDDWGNRFTSLGSSVAENAQRTQIRTTIAQMAMFDAVNAVLDGPYRPFASKPVSAPGASAEAAAIRAAYIVALNEFPTKTATIDGAYNTSIAGVPATPEAIADGIAIGEAAANAVLAARAGDHRNDPELEGYTPGSGPGVWIPTPPALGDPQGAFLQFVTPFGYDDPARFRPHAPPALDSKAYAIDYNEIKDLGRTNETSRTAEQSATALFWSPSATALWTANIRSLASSMDLLTAARFEAIGFAAVTNAVIACWDAKYTYMYWRPVTAIRAGDTDGNSRTESDPAWTPFIVTPSHPEYPSAHTTIGAAALGFYTVWFGTDQFPLEFRGNGAVRDYTSVKEILAEEGNARVWGGMHWRNSTKMGAKLGSRVATYTVKHLLKPLDD